MSTFNKQRRRFIKTGAAGAGGIYTLQRTHNPTTLKPVSPSGYTPRCRVALMLGNLPCLSVEGQNDWFHTSMALAPMLVASFRNAASCSMLSLS